MTTEQGYNGWTNYETWQASLWLDEGDITAQIEDQGFDCLRDVKDYLQETIEEFYFSDDNGSTLTDRASLVSDILNAWLREVDFDELASHYWTDLDDNDD